jgi:succinate dehydrogenase / fumarate reductase cytochrome b subunit
MNPYIFFWKSSIGKKWLVALTGLVLIGYVIGHMAGNLQIFGPPAAINSYAELLHASPALLWAVRAFLIVCFVLHVVATIKLVIENRAARSERYAMHRHVQSSWAARLMPVSGLVVLAFIVFHILHFTTRNIDPQLRPVEHGGVLRSEYDVHTMVIRGFHDHPFVTAFYVVGLFLLCLHLSHGFSSLAQTFGLNTKRTMHPITIGGRVLAWAIFVGYLIIPVAIWLHLLNPAQP